MANTLFDATFAPLSGRDIRFLILPDGKEWGGDAFFRLIARQAQALRAAGLGVGDRIAVQVAKSPEALAVYGAAVALGAVFLPLNTAYTAAEVDYFLADARPRVFLCDGSKADALAAIADRHGVTLLTLNADGSGSLSDAAAGMADTIVAAERGPDDLAALLYTSGTTGRSKGAMLTHRNLLSNAKVLMDLWRFTDKDVLLHALPIFHTHGLFVASNIALLTGGAMIFLPGFDPEAMLRLMPQATAMMGVPTFYTRLLDDPRFDRDLVAHMRLFISGSAPLLAETHLAFEARTGHRILERYGMTETNMNTSNPYEGDRRAGTVGFPVPGVELRIMADGAEVVPGAVGVIEVRGPNVFAGYWQMPEKTAEELRPDGWFITGDLGQVDTDGYISIVGRQKDLIISGGFNIYPAEVEQAIMAYPEVQDCAVIGVPDDKWGEAVVAVVEPRAGATIDTDALMAAAREALGPVKTPKAIEVVEMLPRSNAGKVLRAELRRDRWAAAGRAI